MAFNLFPYSNFHRLNANWILKKMKEMVALITDKAEEVAAAAHTVQGYEARLEVVEAGVNDLDTSRVSYRHVQELTDTQKQTARGNIGAAPSRGVVMYNEAQLLDDTYKAQARTNIGALGSADLPDVSDVVRYSTQTPTDAQKLQARENIGAAAAGDIPTGVVLYSEAQSLSTAERFQARENIGAQPAGVVPAGAVRYDALQELTSLQQAQARVNIGAAADQDIPSLESCVQVDESQTFTEAQQAQARLNIGIPDSMIAQISYDAQDGYELDVDLDELVTYLETPGSNVSIYAVDVAGWPGAPSGALLSNLENVILDNVKVFREANSDDLTIQASSSLSEASALTKLLQVTIAYDSTGPTTTITASFVDQNQVPAASAGDVGKVLTAGSGGAPAWAEPDHTRITILQTFSRWSASPSRTWDEIVDKASNGMPISILMPSATGYVEKTIVLQLLTVNVTDEYMVAAYYSNTGTPTYKILNKNGSVT